MQNSSLSKNDLELHKAFEIIASIQTFSKYINEIIESIYNFEINPKVLKDILKANNLTTVKNIKEELLDLLIVYINLILLDHTITENELKNIQYLKRLFCIEEGDFYKKRYDEIEEILNKQFIRMYRNDNQIDDMEAIHKVSLQKLFDLSYDQMLEFKKAEVIAAIERGADLSKLDTAVLLSETMKSPSDVSSRNIKQGVKNLVWNRDGGKCVKCGSNQKLEFDHIIPVSKGGSNTYRNIQLLCENCNRKKSNKLI